VRDEAFSQSLLNWFDQHGRNNLPWQRNTTSYRVWVSEIMLQQTQVVTVIPYFLRFTRRFPDIKSLGRAELDEVLSLWTGLGYYARARNLHKTAQQLITENKAELPATLTELCALPGIGRSTAGAILSISFNIRAPILDGNVKRVLARYHRIAGWPGKTRIANQLWERAEQHTPEKRLAHYTQAIMDLGATTCTRSKPKCADCPLQNSCDAFIDGSTENYPAAKPNRKTPQRNAYFLVCHNTQGAILLEKRPPQGIWGGLWSLPQHEDIEALKDRIEQLLQQPLKILGTQNPVKHTFTHFQLTIKPVDAQANITTHLVTEPGRWKWLQPPETNKLGMAAPIKKLIINSFAINKLQ